MPRKLSTATKEDAVMIELLGESNAYRDEGNIFTREQVESLRRFYGFRPAGDNVLIEAGNLRNLMRAVRHDGKRVMGLLSRYLNKGEDPVGLVITLLLEAGFDCPDSVEEEEDD